MAAISDVCGSVWVSAGVCEVCAVCAEVCAVCAVSVCECVFFSRLSTRVKLCQRSFCRSRLKQNKTVSTSAQQQAAMPGREEDPQPQGPQLLDKCNPGSTSEPPGCPSQQGSKTFNNFNSLRARVIHSSEPLSCHPQQGTKTFNSLRARLEVDDTVIATETIITGPVR